MIEGLERAGLISDLVEEYCAGANGAAALMVEQLAGDAASQGLSGVLCKSSPEMLQKFLDRMLPGVEAKLRLLEKAPREVENALRLQNALTVPPNLAA